MDSKIHHTGRTVALHTKRRLWQGRQWLLARERECFQCRACDRPVGPFETTCPHCGAANPAKITISPAIILCGLGLPTLISLYCLT
jgi:Zn finger protein HypA/HybF involved in hydrogenase expression